MTLQIISPRTRTEFGVTPAVARCTCGAEVDLGHPLDNVCDACGRCFNMSGQEVTPSWQCDEQGNPLEQP